MSIRSAIVTIEDPVTPLISEPTGALADGERWHRGIVGVTFEGSDVTGIRQVGVYKGTTPVVVRTAAGAQQGGCGQLNSGIAYTFTKPCVGGRGVNGPQTLDLNTAGFGDGTSSLGLVVRDTAGNEAERQLVVKVDNTAPAAPQVVADPAWSAAADGTWSWVGSAEPDRASISKVEVERCLGSQGCAVETLPGTSFGGPQQYSHPVPEGDSTVRVRETDAAGNVGAWSQPAAVRRDRTAPGVAVQTQPGAVAGEPLSPQVTATDALSGVARTDVEVRVDGGAWRAFDSNETHPAGVALRFRARAQDHAGNVSGWVESGEVIVRARGETPAPPTSTPPSTAPTVEPQRPPTARRTTRISVRSARRNGRRVIIKGRVRPTSARGTIELRAARWRAKAKLRGSTFTLKLRVRGSVRAVTVAYKGDAEHRPATRRLRVRTAR